MSFYSFIALSTSKEHIYEEFKRFSIEERILKWTKRHKKRNTIYTSVILIIAIVLLVFVMTSQKLNPLKL